MSSTPNKNWPSINGTVVFRDGQHGTYLGLCVMGRSHRVFDNVSTTTVEGTVWLLDNDGACRGDKAPSYRDAEWRVPTLEAEAA